MRIKYALPLAATAILLGAPPAFGAGTGSFVLTAASSRKSAGYAPTFTGNGRLLNTLA